MVNFKEIVLLQEEEAQTNQPANPTAQEQTAPKNESDVVVNYFLEKPNEIFKEYSGVFYQKYKVNIPEEVLRQIINLIRQSGYQNQYVVQNFVRYSDYFPFVDFLTYVIGLADDKQKPNVLEFVEALKKPENKEVFAKAAQAYIQDFKEQPVDDTWPLDYKSRTSHATMLQTGLRQAASKNLIAEATMEKIANLSLRNAIYKLLEIRKKIRDKQNKVPPSNQFVDSLLLTPEKHAGTTVTVPVQFKRLYPDTTVRTLVELGLLIKRLYEHEKKIAQETYNQANPDSKAQIITTLEEFFNNQLNEQKQFEWKVPEEKAPATQQESYQFNEIYKKFLNLLQEKDNTVGYTKAYGDNYDAIFNKGNQTQANPTTQQPPKPATNQETPNKETKNPLLGPAEEGYVVKNIKNMKTNDPAQKVYNKLQSIADYIREAEPFSIVGALQDINIAAKGLGSLGGPNLDR